MNLRLMVCSLAALLISVGFVSACGGSDSSDESGEGPIQVGVLIPQSGDAAVTGRFMTVGAEAAINELNAAGGVNGRQLEYTIYDTVGDPQNGINSFNRFVSDGGKFGVTGFSAVVTAIGPMADGDEVLLVNSGAPPFDVEEMGEDTIHTLNGQDHEMICAAQYTAGTLGANRIASIYADIASNKAGVERYGEAVEENGGEVVAQEGTAQGESDFRSILTRAKDGNPDLVYIYTYGSDPGNIMKQMDELGIDAIKMGYSGAAVDQTAEVGGRSAEGFIATAGLFDPASNDPKMESFVKAYRAEDPNTPREDLTFYHATLYDGVMMLAQAMEHVAERGGNPDDPSEVREAFFDIGTFDDVVTGEAVYEDGDPVPKKPFQVLEIQDGKFVPVDSLTC